MALILSGTNGLSDVDGSAATPAIRGTDANTGMFFPAADTIAFSEGGVEAMRLDSSGQVGVGITPLSTQGNLQVYKNISGGSPATSGATDANQVFAVNYASVQTSFGAYANGNAWIQQRAGGNFAANYDLVLQPNGGNVGIGTGSPVTKFNVVGGRTTLAANGEIYALGVQFSSSTGPYYIGASNSVTPDLLFSQVGGSERMRLTNAGDLLVGTTSAGVDKVRISASHGPNANLGLVCADDINGNYIIFRNAATTAIGSVTRSGTSSVAYNTSSDYRLKNAIAPMTGALAKVAALKPVTYKWNADGSAGEGFIAHELAEVVPDAVTGAKDAVDADGNPVYQGIDTSFLVATLTAAIQEQQAMIEQLKADVAALKGTV